MADQFVIHEHSGYGPLHFDFMLQSGSVLATWQLPASPAELQAGQCLPARKLSDHRIAYLTYQGPVSNGRGQVKALDTGSFNSISSAKGLWEVELIGKVLRGRFELRQIGPAEDAWTLTRLP